MSIARTHIDDFHGSRFRPASAYNVGQQLEVPVPPSFECPSPLLGEQTDQLVQAINHLSGLVSSRTVKYEEKSGAVVRLFCTVEPDGAPDMLFRIRQAEEGLPRLAMLSTLPDHLAEPSQPPQTRDYAIIINQPGISYSPVGAENQLEVTYHGTSRYTPRIFVQDPKHQTQLSQLATQRIADASVAIEDGEQSSFSGQYLREKAWKLATQLGLVAAGREMPA